MMTKFYSVQSSAIRAAAAKVFEVNTSIKAVFKVAVVFKEEKGWTFDLLTVDVEDLKEDPKPIQEPIKIEEPQATPSHEKGVEPQAPLAAPLGTKGGIRYKRPGKRSVKCRRVWDLCDAYSLMISKKDLRKEVLKTALEEGLNRNMVSQNFHYWNHRES